MLSFPSTPLAVYGWLKMYWLVLIAILNFHSKVECRIQGFWGSMEAMMAEEGPRLRGFAQGVENHIVRFSGKPEAADCQCVQHACGPFFTTNGVCFNTKAPAIVNRCERPEVDCAPTMLHPTYAFVRTPPSVDRDANFQQRILEAENGQVARELCVMGALETDVLQEAGDRDVLHGVAFFGTMHGNMWYWPGLAHDKDDDGNCEKYDPRVRAWFLQTLAAPKVMVIIKDDGVRKLIDQTVINHLNTLGSRDYFSVLSYHAGTDKTAKKPHLRRATESNLKQEMKEGRQAAGLFGIKNAFRYAFEMIRDPAVPNLDKMIVFLSGTPVEPELSEDVLEMIATLQSEEDFVAIMTYTVALGETDDFPMQLACGSKGVMTKIHDFSAPDMSAYYHMALLPAAFQKTKPDFLHLSPKYLDKFGQGDVITISKGYYETCEGSDPGPKRIPLGVVAVDLPLRELEKKGISYKEYLRYIVDSNPKHMGMKTVGESEVECQLQWIREQSGTQCPGPLRDCDSHNVCRERKNLDLILPKHPICNWNEHQRTADNGNRTICCSKEDSDRVCPQKGGRHNSLLFILLICIVSLVGIITGILLFIMCMSMLDFGPPNLTGKIHDRNALGVGASSRVRKAKLKASTGRRKTQDVAIKIFKPNQTKYFDEERNIFCKIGNHDNVVRLLGVEDHPEGHSENHSGKLLILELMGMNLGTFLRDYRPSLKYHDVLETLIQACAGLEHIHKKRVAHRDIKPENILVTIKRGGPLKCIVKLCDFGHAKYCETNPASISGVRGTLGYISPELAFKIWGRGNEEEMRAGTATDIHSFGQVICESIVGRKAFQNDWQGGMHQEIEDLIVKCQETNQELRPKASEVLSELRTLLSCAWASELVPQLDDI